MPVAKLGGSVRIVSRQWGPTALSHNGKIIYQCATGSMSGVTVLTAQTLATKALRLLHSWPASRNAFCSMAVDPSGQNLVAATAAGLAEINLATGQFRRLPGLRVLNAYSITGIAW